MSRSEKWQKFYKWYSLISIVLVALVGLLVIIGSGWAAQQEMLLTLALDLSMALFALTVTGGDLLLWAVSVVVWCCSRESTKLWKVLAWGLAMLAAKFVNLVLVFGLAGGVM